MQTKKRSKTLRLATLAIMSAIIIVMSFTPLGYLKIGTVEITFLTIPVVLGAIIMGPIDGAVLGAVFGLTSFIQCFGMSPFGAMLLSINPIYTFITCLIPRILIGFIAGYVFKQFEKHNANRGVSYTVSSLLGVLTNTVFFFVFVILLFGQTEYIQSFGNSVITIVITLAGINAVIELVVCTVLSAVLAKPLIKVVNKMSF